MKTLRIVFAGMLATSAYALTGCASKKPTSGSLPVQEVHELLLNRITSPGPDGEPVTFWAGKVPEQLVRDAMGNDAVDSCLAHIEAGSRGCMGRLTEHVEFRLMTIESDSSWWIEFDAMHGDDMTHEWLFSREEDDGSWAPLNEQL